MGLKPLVVYAALYSLSTTVTISSFKTLYSACFAYITPPMVANRVIISTIQIVAKVFSAYLFSPPIAKM